jgi:hypothetical protein
MSTVRARGCVALVSAARYSGVAALHDKLCLRKGVVMAGMVQVKMDTQQSDIVWPAAPARPVPG